MARQAFTSTLKEKYLQNLRDGMRRGAAAEALKLSRMTVLDYIDDHPDFEKRVLDAELEANEHVEEALYQAAVSGNVAAARAWLELRGPHKPLPPAGASAPPSGPDEDELFDNVHVMDPRRRRRS